MSYARSVKFIASAEEEILDIAEVKEVLKSLTNCKTDAEYKAMKEQGIIMNVDIFTKNTRVKINNGLYNDLIENVVYTTDNITRIRSIKTETDATGTIAFKMRGDE